MRPARGRVIPNRLFELLESLVAICVLLLYGLLILGWLVLHVIRDLRGNALSRLKEMNARPPAVLYAVLLVELFVEGVSERFLR